MTETKHGDVDWATAAEQSSDEDEAQEGNILAEEEGAVEPAEHAALHIIDPNANVEDNLDAALDALAEATDPEADEVVNDALDIDSADEAEAAAEAVEDEVDVETEAADEAAAEETPEDPYDEFRKELRFQPGKWYVIHSYAGFERRVKSNIENRKQSLAMEDYIYQVEVPMEDVVEIKNGQRKMVTRVRIPGYVLVRMDLNEDSWSVVRHTPGVTGFVGNSHNPTPLRFEEAFGMLKSLVEITEAPSIKTGGGQGGKAASRVLPAEIDFEIGETITIKEGSFAGLPGSINEIKPESGKLIVLVSLFERETPVELSFDQVTKL
ncbi:transcription antitermination protein nusG [Cryobacterium psychrotolerans]|uniref:Transcription termination/antitermination protein NusG n=1 Tax=Cryobacterium psychrotolerans TaxID=386301 RepID=A0A1G9D9L7_9MICO|nr:MULTISPECIES: transcription termination/antitermination protein NusG [Cryobacterium]TFD47227.1 transcription termination/antitermination protein NusG [Cryobacterium sp. TMT1-2-1]TFD90324.1 transcription termination/antitermination protein NusG [Cryobacterium psychrotolerans]SDK60557.1 transcription antitermination protein nusG [Cryobacterium psychrotolerans]